MNYKILRLIIVVSIIFGGYYFFKAHICKDMNIEGFEGDLGEKELNRTLKDRKNTAENKAGINKTGKTQIYRERLNDLDAINKLDELTALMDYGTAEAVNNKKKRDSALKRIQETTRINEAIKRATEHMGGEIDYKPPAPLSKFSVLGKFLRK